jgi:hypothetical protein
MRNASRWPHDAQPPLVKFPARFGIIEAKGDRMLPVTLRNVEASLAVAQNRRRSLRVNDAAWRRSSRTARSWTGCTA